MAPVRAIENCRKDERKVRKGKRRVAKKNDSIRKIGREISMNNGGRRKGKKNLKRMKKQNREQTAHNVCVKQLRDDASRLKCGEHQQSDKRFTFL